MEQKEKITRNLSAKGWIRCNEYNYPDYSEGPIIIAYWEETDKKWYYWLFENCPYGWNVLCRSEAYYKKIQEPFR